MSAEGEGEEEGEEGEPVAGGEEHPPALRKKKALQVVAQGQ